MRFEHFILKCFRRIHQTIRIHKYEWFDESRVKYFNQEANDFVRESILSSKNGLMVCKFGTIELNAVCCCKRCREGLDFQDYIDYIHQKGCIFPEECLRSLRLNAGFFPDSVDFMKQYAELVLEDIKYIDILGSYIDQEEYLSKELQGIGTINLDGYCAPFCWDNPWTSLLKGKKVLVVHPFTESIKKQYEKREYLFDNPEVLPEFENLLLVKAVQSIADNKTGFETWFDALEHMKREIDRLDYDIALIGCGAYGMNLAAHIKRKGKIAIHLAGWTQMLFGIYGKRWVEDQPEYAGFINDNWIRPSDNEKPQNAEKVEGGCYW